MVSFDSMFADLGRMGFMDTILPFMLIFAIIYFTLTTVLHDMFGKKKDSGGKPTGEDNSKYAIVIAFVIALGVVIPHTTGSYPPGLDVVDIINSALPSVVVVAVAILGLMVLLGMFNIKILEWGGKAITPIIVLVSLGIIIWIFVSASGRGIGMPYWLRSIFGPDTMTLLVALLVFGLLVWFITRKPKSKAEKDANRFKGLKEFDKLFRE